MIFYFNQISFEAYITVTWISGGVCTISNGNVSYTAPNTSGSYKFTVEEEGTYTATVTVGSYTFTGSVSITENGQSKTLAVDCDYVLYNAGTKYVTWQEKHAGNGSSYITWKAASVYLELNSYRNTARKMGLYTLINELTPFKTLEVTVASISGNNYEFKCGVTSGAPTIVDESAPSGFVASKTIGSTGIHSIDISKCTTGGVSLTGFSYYAQDSSHLFATVTKILLKG